MTQRHSLIGMSPCDYPNAGFEAAGMPEPTSVEVLETHNIEQR